LEESTKKRQSLVNYQVANLSSTAKKRKRNEKSVSSPDGEEEMNESISCNKTPCASFENAKPTLTHRAITYLALPSVGIIHYCITQNVDGLHMRSGLPRSQHCFLHGCIFTEKCENCHCEYFRDFDVGGVSFQPTGRKCEDVRCQGILRDTILDWEDELPQDDWMRAQNECMKSDLVLALGTSLRIEPAGSLPTLGKKFVIVNKQETPYDKKAEIVIRADVDQVMERVMQGLGLENWEMMEKV
jgi:mono-ADP-ribosyltransferase sirtuin 6